MNLAGKFPTRSFNVARAVFVIVGLGFFCYSCQNAWRSYAAGAWPTTTGALLSSELRTHRYKGTRHRVAVDYAYEVQGKRYRSDVFAIGYQSERGDSGRTAALLLLDKLKSAPQVTVRYRPDDPADAVLSHGAHKAVVNMMVFAIVWCGWVIALPFIPRWADRPHGKKTLVAAVISGFFALSWFFSRQDSTLLNNLTVQ